MRPAVRPTAQHLLRGLLASAIATAGVLIGLILAFASVSGGHFNPLITGLQWFSGERKPDCTLAYAAAQFQGRDRGRVAVTMDRLAAAVTDHGMTVLAGKAAIRAIGEASRCLVRGSGDKVRPPG